MGASSPEPDGGTALLNIYGQKTQPEETPEFLSKSHAALLEEVGKLPEDDKKGWTTAQQKCPELVGEDHRLMFLRCEVFNEELAALRLCKYWNRRIELFGQNRAFKPIHLGGDGALSSNPGSSDGGGRVDDSDGSQDDVMVRYTIKGINLGFMRPTRTHDAGGRAILFVDPSRLKGYDKGNNHERLGVARALWYVIHNVLEGNDAVQRLGIVVLAHPQHVKLSYFDRKLLKLNGESMSGCLPVRMGGMHVCNPPWFFGKVIFPVMKIVMPERMRKRIRVHSGEQGKVLKDLEGFGLSKEMLPTELGGEVVMDNETWMQDMKAK